jgi:hypothetical protein
MAWHVRHVFSKDMHSNLVTTYQGYQAIVHDNTTMDQQDEMPRKFFPLSQEQESGVYFMFYYSLLEYIGILSIKLILFQGGKHTQSKGGILAKACEYLADLR